MDWRIYRAIYDVSLDHHWVGTLFSDVEKASIPFMVVVTVGLWLLARPGGSPKWKVAATAGLGSAALALGINRLIAAEIWDRHRPYAEHSIAHPWSSTTDPSFPSDHASAAFAIAFAVLAFSLPAGALFLAGAVAVAFSRIAGGLHYPSDVGAGFVIGLVCALVVVTVGREPIERLVALLGRVSDPLVGPVRARIEAALRLRPRGQA